MYIVYSEKIIDGRYIRDYYNRLPISDACDLTIELNSIASKNFCYKMCDEIEANSLQIQNLPKIN